MVTVTFQGTPAEIHSDMCEMLNLSKGAAATRAIGEGPQMTRTEVMARVQERSNAVDKADALTYQAAGRTLEGEDQLGNGAAPATRQGAEQSPQTMSTGAGLNGQIAQNTASPSEKPKRTRRTKAEIEAANAAKSNGATDHAPAASETTSRAEEAPAAASVVPPIVNKEAVHQALQQVNVAVGLPKAREILSKFNVNRISEIKEDQFAKFIEECNSAVMMA